MSALDLSPPRSVVREIVESSDLEARRANIFRRRAAESQARQEEHAEQVAAASRYQMIAAQTSVQQVADEIARFEAELAPDEEAMMCVVGGPAGLMLFPQQVDALAPDKLVFTGVDQNGHRVVAVQHVTQLNLMLRAVPVTAGEEPRRTGFHSPDGDGKGTG